MTKTSELTNAALDWAVATCEGYKPRIEFHPTTTPRVVGICIITRVGGLTPYSPSTDWSQGGPIIEREKIELVPSIGGTVWYADRIGPPTCRMERCPTPLIAAMRCYVASKLGNEVEVPEELL